MKQVVGAMPREYCCGAMVNHPDPAFETKKLISKFPGVSAANGS